MFNPFNDPVINGYLRNKLDEMDLTLVKRHEHAIYTYNLPEALDYLESAKGLLIYDDFLAVHKILFSDFYPWAGKDRLELCPDISVSKGDIIFA